MKDTLTVPDTTPLEAFIKERLPWAHAHQINAIATLVAAVIAKQRGCQAELARTQGNQEAATNRLSRLIHTARLSPKAVAEGLCRRALEQAPRTGQVRLSMDWTSEGDQPLRVVSLVVGCRAWPIFWRAYDRSVLKGRRRRYERAVLKRAFKLIFAPVEPHRLKRTAERGFPDEDRFELFDPLGVFFIPRVKGSVKVATQWRKLTSLRFAGHARRRNLGRLAYWESKPRQVWGTRSRARNTQGPWELGYRVSNRPRRAKRRAIEYGYRFCGEEGFRDAKG
jgi:hypothetical protein